MQRAESKNLQYGRDAVEGHATARIEIGKPAWGDLLHAVRSQTLKPTPLPTIYHALTDARRRMHPAALCTYRPVSPLALTCAAAYTSRSCHASRDCVAAPQFHNHDYPAPVLRFLVL